VPTLFGSARDRDHREEFFGREPCRARYASVDFHLPFIISSYSVPPVRIVTHLSTATPPPSTLGDSNRGAARRSGGFLHQVPRQRDGQSPDSFEPSSLWSVFSGVRSSTDTPHLPSIALSRAVSTDVRLHFSDPCVLVVGVFPDHKDFRQSCTLVASSGKLGDQQPGPGAAPLRRCRRAWLRLPPIRNSSGLPLGIAAADRIVRAGGCAILASSTWPFPDSGSLVPRPTWEQAVGIGAHRGGEPTSNREQFRAR